MGEQTEQIYGATVRTTADSTFLAVRAREFRDVFRSWYPMAVHLLQGLFMGQRNTSSVIGQRERLLALGKLSAGDVTASELAGEPITERLTEAPGNKAPLGGLKVVTEGGWFAARPSGTEDVYKVYAESFHGPEHLARIQEEAQAVVNTALGE